jgi:hypothetical protein
MREQGRIMRIVFAALSTAAVVFLSVFAPSCGGDDDGAGGAGDAGTDTDTDTDVDAGVDSGSGDPCADGEEVMQPGPDGGPDVPTGIESCSDGSAHRYAALECTAIPIDPTECDEVYNCEDCGPDQVCAPVHWGELFLECDCITPCATDVDCGPGGACTCARSDVFPAHCVMAGCRTDADCGAFECGVDADCGDSSDGIVGFQCRTAEDQCHGSVECQIEDEPYLPYCCCYSQSFWDCEEGYIID